jgi:HAE1 family hydrophobic/amphiphilic exporter-1
MAVARERVRALSDGLAAAELFVQPEGTTFERILRPGTSDIVIRVLGEDASVRDRIAEELRRRIAGVHGLADLSTLSSRGEQEYRLHLNRLVGEQYGITPRDVEEHISSRTAGALGTTLSLIGREVAVRIRPGASGSRTLDDLLASCITRGGTRVPLSLLVRCEAANGQAEVRREDGTPALVMTGNASRRSIGAVAADLRQAAGSFSLPPGCGISIGGENEQMESSFRALGIVIALSLLLVYMILAAEYESLLYPFVIVLTSPLAFTGAVLAMLIAGERYNVMSLVGIAIMIGAVDNDAVIVVDVITALRRQGVPLHMAVRRGLRRRLRAILMTTVTTVLGVLPLVASFGEGSELVRALAIPLAGGLITSTAATLIVIPVVYTYIDPLAAQRL